jgi:hypothetical protein
MLSFDPVNAQWMRTNFGREVVKVPENYFDLLPHKQCTIAVPGPDHVKHPRRKLGVVPLAEAHTALQLRFARLMMGCVQ